MIVIFFVVGSVDGLLLLLSVHRELQMLFGCDLALGTIFYLSFVIYFPNEILLERHNLRRSVAVCYYHLVSVDSRDQRNELNAKTEIESKQQKLVRRVLSSIHSNWTCRISIYFILFLRIAYSFCFAKLSPGWIVNDFSYFFSSLCCHFEFVKRFNISTRSQTEHKPTEQNAQEKNEKEMNKWWDR